MTLVKQSPFVDKVLNFVLKYLDDNNLIVLTGQKSNDLYITNVHPKVASSSITSRHFPSIKELVYCFYIVFKCPNVDTYCHLLSVPTISGFPPNLTAKNIRKHYPTMIPSVHYLSNQKNNSSIYWFSLYISIIKSKKLWLFALSDVIMKLNLLPSRHL